MRRDAYLKADLIKLGYLFAAIAGTITLFFITPSLSTPTLVSIVLTLLLSPLVVALERRGYSRHVAIGILFSTLGLASSFAMMWAIRRGGVQWDRLKERAPDYFHTIITKFGGIEEGLKANYPILKSMHATDTLLNWGDHTGTWFVTHGPALAGQILTCLFLVPFLTFVLLNEGPEIKRRVFHLVPNRFFEIVYLVTNKISTGLADYIRAKAFEAILVGVMTSTGLAAIHAPYAIVLGAIAGLTNIIPYLGPVMGAIPAVIVATLEGSQSQLLVPVLIVYLIVNLVDMVLIFPLIVGRLVNLHPLILLAVVAIGEHYYGLMGMLISIPIATTFKVVLHEVYSAVYERQRFPAWSRIITR
jgi:putative permease